MHSRVGPMTDLLAADAIHEVVRGYVRPPVVFLGAAQIQGDVSGRVLEHVTWAGSQVGCVRELRYLLSMVADTGRLYRGQYRGHQLLITRRNAFIVGACGERRWQKMPATLRNAVFGALTELHNAQMACLRTAGDPLLTESSPSGTIGSRMETSS